MRTSKHVGFLAVALGVSLLLLPAVLPTKIVSRGSGLTRLEVVDVGCGSTAYAAVHHPDRECGQVARQRLVVTSTAGVLLVVVGAVVLMGANDRRRSRLTG